MCVLYISVYAAALFFTNIRSGLLNIRGLFALALSRSPRPPVILPILGLGKLFPCHVPFPHSLSDFPRAVEPDALRYEDGRFYRRTTTED